MRYAQCKKINRELAENEDFIRAFVVSEIALNRKALLQGSLLLLNPRLEMGLMGDDFIHDRITFRLSGHAVKVSRIIKKRYALRRVGRKRNKAIA